MIVILNAQVLSMAMKTLQICARECLAKTRIFFQAKKTVKVVIIVGIVGIGMAVLRGLAGTFGVRAVIQGLKVRGR